MHKERVLCEEKQMNYHLCHLSSPSTALDRKSHHSTRFSKWSIPSSIQIHLFFADPKKKTTVIPVEKLFNIRTKLPIAYEIDYFISQNQLLNSICCQVVERRRKMREIK